MGISALSIVCMGGPGRPLCQGLITRHGPSRGRNLQPGVRHVDISAGGTGCLFFCWRRYHHLSRAPDVDQVEVYSRSPMFLELSWSPIAGTFAIPPKESVTHVQGAGLVGLCAVGLGYPWKKQLQHASSQEGFHCFFFRADDMAAHTVGGRNPFHTAWDRRRPINNG